MKEESQPSLLPNQNDAMVACVMKKFGLAKTGRSFSRSVEALEKDLADSHKHIASSSIEIYSSAHDSFDRSFSNIFNGSCYDHSSTLLSADSSFSVATTLMSVSDPTSRRSQGQILTATDSSQPSLLKVAAGEMLLSEEKENKKK